MSSTPSESSPAVPRWTRLVDRVNERLGRAVAWLTLGMVLIGAFNAVARYLGRYTGWSLSSNAWLELQWYLFSLVFLLAAPWTLQRDAHVRVDVLYSRVPQRVRDWIDFLGSLLFLVPFCIFALLVSWPSVRNSWQVLETSPDPGGLARYPIKSFILVAFFLLLLQGLSEAGKRLAALRARGEDQDPGASS